MKIQLSVIKGAMQALTEGTATGSLSALGLLSDDLKLVTGAIPWTAAERNIVTRTLDALQYGTMDLIGLPRFTIPAEYVAAAIAMFVHPTNIMVACRWLESGQNSANYLGDPSGSSTNTEEIEASQLFALVIQTLNTVDAPLFRKQFETRVTMSANTGERDALTQKLQKIK